MKSLRWIALVLATTWACAAVAYAGDNSGKAAAATSADGCCGGGGATTTAAANPHAACPMGSAACAATMKGHCTAAMRAQCVKAASATADAGSGCPFHAGALAMTGARCELKSASTGDDCAVCADEAACQDELRATGVRAQVVVLKNGAMVVYTAASPRGVRALQASLKRHNEHIMRALEAGGASLCDECKVFRGAYASGKFEREVVNVRNGAQVLLTSSDRRIVNRIHDMTGALALARARS
ncbi:MAG TPA: hypothetical protein VMH61_09235, partial [Candidatus Acidoferrales bacterium]|nr:hypothetical protein [Candidatus Acidoferrales bacterium]